MRRRDPLWLGFGASVCLAATSSLLELTTLRIVAVAIGGMFAVLIVARAIRRHGRGTGWNDALWG